jgi:TetR/AcrR family transcriptional regulator, regulator of biofilm formation and stress response
VPHVPTEVRRQQFIDAAVKVISRVGVDGATTRRIADEAGAPLATLHYCFQTKENLLWAVFEQLAELTRTKIEKAQTQGKSLSSIVEWLVTETVQWAVESPELNRAQIEILLWAERNDRPLAVRIFDTFIDSWMELLRGAKSPLPEDELETLTRVIVAVVDGLCIQMITHCDDKKLFREAETATAMLAAYLNRRPRRAA